MAGAIEGCDVASVIGLEGIQEYNAVGSKQFFDDQQGSFRFRIGNHDRKPCSGSEQTAGEEMRAKAYESGESQSGCQRKLP